MIGDIPIARSTLSQHLKELKYAGLIQGDIEPPKIKYCINRANWEIAKILLTEFVK
jgi:DNA-binding HxlR family transcriptional regulator